MSEYEARKCLPCIKIDYASKQLDQNSGQQKILLYVAQKHLSQTSRATKTALVPPKANEFDMMILTFWPVRPSLGT